MKKEKADGLNEHAPAGSMGLDPTLDTARQTESVKDLASDARLAEASAILLRDIDAYAITNYGRPFLRCSRLEQMMMLFEVNRSLSDARLPIRVSLADMGIQ